MIAYVGCASCVTSLSLRCEYSILSFFLSDLLPFLLPSFLLLFFLFHFPTKICTLFFAETRNFNAMCRMSPVRIPTFLGRKILLSLLLKISALRNSSLIAPFLTDIEQSRSKCFYVKSIQLLLANVNSCSCSLYVVVRPSVCLSVVCRLSVTFMHPTQPIEIFGNVSVPCNTLVT